MLALVLGRIPLNLMGKGFRQQESQRLLMCPLAACLLVQLVAHPLTSVWAIGAKFSYSYMGGSSATTNRILIPQYGTYPSGASFTGNAVAASYQKTIKNQISLIPYFGQSFDRSTIYFGVGPTLSQANTKIDNLIGFADLNGVRTDVSGTPQNFSATQWVYGGAAMLGGTYFLDKAWFLDFSYTYAMTQNKTSNYYSTFDNPGTTTSYKGSLIGSSTGTASIQTVGLTINKLF